MGRRSFELPIVPGGMYGRRGTIAAPGKSERFQQKLSGVAVAGEFALSVHRFAENFFDRLSRTERSAPLIFVFGSNAPRGTKNLMKEAKAVELIHGQWYNDIINLYKSIHGAR